MLDADACKALESMMRATEDDATPIIRRLARIQARHVLDASAGGDAIPAGEGTLANPSVFGKPTLGLETADCAPKPPAGGDAGAVERAVEAMRRSRQAWSNVLEFGLIAESHREATEALIDQLDEARAALALPAPVVEGVTERDVDALRYVLNWADSRTQARTILKAFTVEDGEKVTTEDRLDGLWRKLSAALSEGRSHG